MQFFLKKFFENNSYGSGVGSTKKRKKKRKEKWVNDRYEKIMR